MKKSFSLIELLISLIIISLILAAFSPLITKKLKASDITVGSFGNNGAVGVKRNVTKQDCERLNAVYIPAAMNDGVKPVCVTKYNVGDNEGSGGVPIAGDVQKLAVGQTCTDIGNCCWKGQTSPSGSCSDDGNYSGCNRTMCNWRAANTSCNSYAPSGTMPGMWRLPKIEEMDGWESNINSLNHNKGKDGLMLCDEALSGEAYVRCWGLTNGCPGAFANSCYAFDIWAFNEAGTGYHLVKGMYVGALRTRQLDSTYAMSARCVLDSIYDTVATGNGGLQSADNVLDSQADCDRLGAGLLFIPKETTGTKNMCVMKYNIGDTGVENWVGVQRCTAGGSCTVENSNKENVTKEELTPTCWQGQTAEIGKCNNSFGGYSGCSRTVCNWTGAAKMCENYRLGTYGWRLPTYQELDGIANDENKYSNPLLSSKGLMFCNYDTASTTAPICKCNSSSCTNAYNHMCGPRSIWSSTETNSKADVKLLAGGWSKYSYHFGFALSARCVLDEDAFKNGFTNYVMPSEPTPSEPQVETREPTGQPDCDPYNAIYIEKAKNGGKTAVCAMTYNIGDVYTNPEVRVVNVGTTCLGKYCCWQGHTASTVSGKCTDDGNYSGCSRTLCNWDASNLSCNTYAPDGIKGLWRLPNIKELDAWANNINELNHNKGTNGLMLCDHDPSASGSALCFFLEDGCPKAAANNCNPSYVWSSTEESSDVYYFRYLMGGVFHPNRYSRTHAFSARCVTDKIPL